LILSVTVALAAGVVVAAWVSSALVLSLLTQAVIYAVFASGVGLLLKQNGMVSFGHALYFGASGYALGIVLKLNWLPVELAIVLTLLMVAAFAFVIGLVIVRVPGIAFSMLTLAIGQMFFLIAFRSRGLTGGADGLNIDWPITLFGVPQSLLLKPAAVFLVCWCVLVLMVTGLTLLLRGRFGSVTEAVRDNEERARFIGLRTLLPRAGIYALSGAIAALAGVLSALNTSFVSPNDLHWSVSGVVLMMAVVGGYRVLWGPPLGAIVYFLFKDALGSWTADHGMAVFGIALICVTVFSPAGLAGALQYLGRGGLPSRIGALTRSRQEQK